MRSRVNRKDCRVCAGFAEYFDLDVTVVRVVWLIVALFGGRWHTGLHHCVDRDARGAGSCSGRTGDDAPTLSRRLRTRIGVAKSALQGEEERR